MIRSTRSIRWIQSFRFDRRMILVHWIQNHFEIRNLNSRYRSIPWCHLNPTSQTSR
jgi:hypothetical protein